MLLEMFLGRTHHLAGLEEEPSLLEPGDDVANQTSLDAVRLDHDESLLH